MAIVVKHGNYDNFRWLSWFPTKLPKNGSTAMAEKYNGKGFKCLYCLGCRYF